MCEPCNPKLKGSLLWHTDLPEVWWLLDTATQPFVRQRLVHLLLGHTLNLLIWNCALLCLNLHHLGWGARGFSFVYYKHLRLVCCSTTRWQHWLWLDLCGDCLWLDLWGDYVLWFLRCLCIFIVSRRLDNIRLCCFLIRQLYSGATCW